MKTTISANILVRNEIKFVDGLLKNLLAAEFDEILFLDGGSTDGTIETIKSYMAHHNHIQLISWPQRDGTDYGKGFREADRRNLLLSLSQSDYVFSLDADERIGYRCKDLSLWGDIVVVPLIQYWGSYQQVRLSTADDNKWGTSYKQRIIKKDNAIRFNSRHASGLHNHLEKNGKKIPYRHNAPFRKRISDRLIQRFRNINVQTLPDKFLIHHLHYAELSKKSNDCRINDLENGKILVVKDEAAALKFDRRKDHVLCVKDVGNTLVSQISSFL